MKASAEDVVLGPPGVVTVISTVAAASAGEVALIEVDEVTDTAVPTPVPKLTVEPEVNPVPVMVTVVPPATGPAVGLTALTVGTAS